MAATVAAARGPSALARCPYPFHCVNFSATNIGQIARRDAALRRGAAMAGNAGAGKGLWRAAASRACWRALGVAGAAVAAGGLLRHQSRPVQRPAAPPPQPRPPPAPAAIGAGEVRVGADPAAVGAAAMPALAAQSMKNAAEMALAEFKQPEHPAAGEGRRRQLRRARSRPRSRRSPKAPRSSSGRCSRNRSARSGRSRAPRGVPVIAFSTDASVASARRLSA